MALQFWHLGAAKKKADREAQDERSAAYQCALLVPMDMSMIAATDV